MRVLRLTGIARDCREAHYLLNQLRPRFDHEYHRAGVIAWTFPLGPKVLFSRKPVRTLAELRQGRYFIWDEDEVLKAELPLLGIHAVPLPLDQAARAYEQGTIDGFITPASRVFDALAIEDQQLINGASAKTARQVSEIGEQTDIELLGRLLMRQGVTTLPAGPALSSQFFDEAVTVRGRLGEGMVDRALLRQVLNHMADSRLH